jgi:hypothetical protein
VAIYTPVVQTKYLPQGLFAQAKFAALMASGAVDVATLDITKKGGEFVNIPKYVQAASFTRVPIATVSAAGFTAFSTNDGKVPVLRDSSNNKWYKHQLALAAEDFGQKVAMTIGNKLACRAINVMDYSMQGLINTATGSAHLHDITSEVVKTMNVLDTQQARSLMGDQADQLHTMLIHSKPWNSLLKDLITTYKYAGVWSGEILQNGMLETILGVRNIIVTDCLTPEAGATSSAGDDSYYTWLLTDGALYMAYQQEPYVDMWEDPTNSDTIHYEKIALDYVAAPRAGYFATANPTDANLLTSGLWSTSYEDHRNLGIVAIKSLNG